MMLMNRIRVPNLLSVERLIVSVTQNAGLKEVFAPPPKRDIEWPEKGKLRTVEKVPQYSASQRPFKMQKKIRLMRGPERVHNQLMHKQFGIIALRGGRMKFEHFEVIRMTFLRRFDFKKTFAIWRVVAPWQPMTKKGQGHRMGGGKSAIDHYATPIRAGRVIVEVAGDIQYFEVQKVMESVADRLPFEAKAVTWEMMEEERLQAAWEEKNNINPYTWKYIIQNNMGGCHNWIKPVDKYWFCKYD